MEVGAQLIAPFLRGALLLAQQLLDPLVQGRRDAPGELLPARAQREHLLVGVGPRVVDVLDDGLAAVQPVRVRHVVEEQQQLVGAGAHVLVAGGPRLGEQAGEAGAGGDAAVHADAVAIREVVGAPGGVLVAVHVGAVMVAGPHHEPHPERGGVLLVQLPRLAQQLAQHLTHQRIGAEGRLDPLLQDPCRVELRVPGQASQREQVRLGEGVPGPELVGPDVRDGDQPTRMLRGARDQLGERGRAGLLLTEGEAKVLTPPGREVAQVLLLPGVLLGHLHLDREAGAGHRADHGGDRLASLEVHRAVLDLHDHVLVEAAVQRGEVIVRGARPVGAPIAPVLVVVVDEGPPEHLPAVRGQRPGQQVRAIGMVAAVGERPGLALRVGLDHETAEVRDRGVDRVGGAPPPVLHLDVQRVGGLQPAQQARRGEGDRQQHRDALGAEDLREARHLVQARGQQRGLVGVDVHVVQRDPVDAHGGEQARVVLHSAQILAQLAVLVEQGAPGIPALDLPHHRVDGHVVPVIEHPDGLRGAAQRPVLARGIPEAQQHRVEAVQQAPVAAGDEEEALAVGPQGEGLLARGGELREHPVVDPRRAGRGRIVQHQGSVGPLRERAQASDLGADGRGERPARLQVHLAGQARGGLRTEPGEILDHCAHR